MLFATRAAIRWGLAGELPKLAFEVPEAPESDAMGDSSKGEVGSLPQELLRLLTPDLDQVLLKRHVDDAMEQPTEVILAQAGLGRDHFEVQPLGITLMHECDGPLDSRMGQRGLVDGKAVARLSGSFLYHVRTFPRAPKHGAV